MFYHFAVCLLRQRPLGRVFNQLSDALIGPPHLSHWNDDMAVASILTGKTQVVLRQADLSKRVKMAEGHPQEAFVHL